LHKYEEFSDEKEGIGVEELVEVIGAETYRKMLQICMIWGRDLRGEERGDGGATSLGEKVQAGSCCPTCVDYYFFLEYILKGVSII
jgi:hypothetical protein